MIKIDRVIVVEGKYDKIKLASIFDAVIIATDGFAIFKDKEKMEMLRVLAKEKGLLILTDSDSAGFKIRSYLCGSIPKSQIVNAYIPDLFGKEKRKAAPSKEGKLGVEGVPVQAILGALSRAGISADAAPKTDCRRITKTDLFEDGFSGRPDSRENRCAFQRFLGLPERLSANGLVEVLNCMMDYDAYRESVRRWAEIKNTK